MKIVVLTSSPRSTASYCIPLLAASTKADIVKVIYCRGEVVKNRKYFFRRLKKVWKIGILGAINGIIIRKWFDGADLKPGLIDIREVCLKLNIPFVETPSVNHPDTIMVMKEAEADLGISLSNSYISKRVFSIPRNGMINIHGEILPAFQNAQSVIWQIYEGSSVTGYTIHRIDSKIDTGDIIKQEVFPIVFKETLELTVRHTVDEILQRAGAGLVDVINNAEEYMSHPVPQKKGKTYTTPSLRQFTRIKRKFWDLSAKKD
jgi:methionyl-tRNA formyltransferase